MDTVELMTKKPSPKYKHGYERLIHLKYRWGDVIKWKSFWDDLERTILAIVASAWMSGYRSGKREKL